MSSHYALARSYACPCMPTCDAWKAPLICTTCVGAVYSSIRCYWELRKKLVKIASKKANVKEQESESIVPDEKIHAKFGAYVSQLMRALSPPLSLSTHLYECGMFAQTLLYREQT
jgi:hypothetical protein